MTSRAPDGRPVESAGMLPTIEWQDDAVVMIDQRKLPSKEVYVRCKTVERGRQGDQDHGDPRRAGHRRRRRRWAWPSACKKSTATGTRQLVDRVPQVVRGDGRDAADRGQPVLGHRADEAALRGAGARPARRSTDIKAALVAEAAADPRRGRRQLQGARAPSAPTLVPGEATILTHCNAGALATAGYGTALGVIRGAVDAGKTRQGARRRDAAVPAGRAADRLGAGARTASTPR